MKKKKLVTQRETSGANNSQLTDAASTYVWTAHAAYKRKVTPAPALILRKIYVRP